MLNKVMSVLDNEVGTFTPMILQLPLAVMVTSIATYFYMFGADFYQKPAELLLK
jgi:hypothetical protein